MCVCVQGGVGARVHVRALGAHRAGRGVRVRCGGRGVGARAAVPFARAAPAGRRHRAHHLLRGAAVSLLTYELYSKGPTRG